MSACTLHIGSRIVVRNDGGPLDVEYALFDAADIELGGSTGEPGVVREHGYATTVAEARQRLEALGITRALAMRVADALRERAAPAFARGAAMRDVAARLDAAEMLEGGTLVAPTRSYAGSWLDLTSLAEATGVPRASAVLQALGLAAALGRAEAVDPGLGVRLASLAYTKTRRPGERTHRRVALAGVAEVVAAVTRGPLGRPPLADDAEGPTRGDLLTALHARAHEVPPPRDAFVALVTWLAARDMPVRGPLADADAWRIEGLLAAGEVRGVAALLDDLERTRGKQPVTTYLRARLALLERTEAPHVLAERVASLASAISDFPELGLLAAEACAAADDTRRALAYARDVAMDGGADVALRDRARAVARRLEDGERASSGRMRVSDVGQPPTLDRPTQREWVPAPLPPAAPRPSERRSAPSLRVAEPLAEGRYPSSDRGIPVARITAAPRARTTAPPNEGEPPPSSPNAAPRGTFMRGASQPPYRTDVPPSCGARFRAGPTEACGTLSFPHGAPAEPIVDGTRPRSFIDARTYATQLTRELARAYDVRYGVELRTDLRSIEIVQRHLKDRYPGGEIRSEDEARDVRRHGAFVSEVLARALGAEWVDVAPSEVGYWAMNVPPGTRVWPFGRVLRFVALGHAERDLVSYFLELERRQLVTR